MTENKNRVCCLYRVSTDKQVDFNSNHEADLPMQRKACHKFAEAKGWVIVHEEQEEGVSGHKVRAEARDKLQMAQDGTFTTETIVAIMGEEKKSELDTVTIKNDTLRKYFPRSYTPKQMEDTIIKLLEQWQKKRQHSEER